MSYVCCLQLVSTVSRLFSIPFQYNRGILYYGSTLSLKRSEIILKGSSYFEAFPVFRDPLISLTRFIIVSHFLISSSGNFPTCIFDSVKLSATAVHIPVFDINRFTVYMNVKIRFMCVSSKCRCFTASNNFMFSLLWINVSNVFSQSITKCS